MSGPSFGGTGLCEWELAIPRSEVMWLRYVLEASEGVGFLSGGENGVVTLLSPESQAHTVRAILRDLGNEMDLQVRREPPPP